MHFDGVYWLDWTEFGLIILMGFIEILLNKKEAQGSSKNKGLFVLFIDLEDQQYIFMIFKNFKIDI